MRDFQTKQNEGGLPDSIIATNLGAGESNSFLTESKGAVESSGQTLAPADGTGEETDQLSRALAIYGAGGGAYHNDTGSVNAYVLTPISPKESPPEYFDGFEVVFRPGNINTGASTVNVGSLGVKDIATLSGTPLQGHEIIGVTRLIYNSAEGEFVIASVSHGYDMTANNFGIKLNPTLQLLDPGDQIDTTYYGSVWVAGNGAPVTLTNTSSTFLGAYDSKIVIIQGRNNTNTVTIQDSGDDYLRLKTASFTLNAGAILILQYQDTLSGWVEVNRCIEQAAITKPSGGATIDTQARAAIDSIIDALAISGVTN